jgi:hypothetical protein
VKSPIGYNPLFIPPILSDLEKLAWGDPDTCEKHRKLGRDPEDELERLVWMAFRMLGFEVEELGHMAPGERCPDGIAYSRRDHYAILLDSKIGGAGYSVGTDDRALLEYIKTETPRLESEGIDGIYFCIISSGFKGDHQSAMLRIRKETRAKNVSFLSAGMLLRLVELKLRFPKIIPTNLEAMFLRSDIVQDADIQRELGDLIG